MLMLKNPVIKEIIYKMIVLTVEMHGFDHPMVINKANHVIFYLHQKKILDEKIQT